MANIKQQAKRNLTNEKKRLINAAFKSSVKTALKGVEVAVENKDLEERQKDKEDIFSYKEVLISPSDFSKKADYSCYVFTTIEEAVDEYLKNNEEQIETKEDFYIWVKGDEKDV